MDFSSTFFYSPEILKRIKQKKYFFNNLPNKKIREKKENV